MQLHLNDMGWPGLTRCTLCTQSIDIVQLGKYKHMKPE
jgi:hypothetical protein